MMLYIDQNVFFLQYFIIKINYSNNNILINIFWNKIYVL